VKVKTLGVLALVVVLCAVFGWMACVRRDRVAAPGEELVFDDFGFSVQDVKRNGTVWIVDLKVANHAQRVGYKLDNHQVVVVDEQGRTFTETKGVDAGARAPVAELPHGESCITRLVFDVPEDAREPRLKIRFGNVGSVLDFVLLGDWSLALH
jgi:hypothetical protein